MTAPDRAQLRQLILDAEATVETAVTDALRRYLAILTANLPAAAAVTAAAGDPNPEDIDWAALTDQELFALVDQLINDTFGPDTFDQAANAWPGIVDQTILPALEEIMQPVFDAAATAADQDVLDAVNAWRVDYLEQRTQTLADIPDEVTAEFREKLGERIQEEGPDARRAAELARETLTPDSPVSKTRAETIGRTETGSALNNGARAAWEAVDDSLGDTGTVFQTWVATDDSKTRPSHRKVDGTRVKLGDTFDVGGASMLGPHDPTAPPGEVIQCRCSSSWDIEFADETDAGSDDDGQPGLPPPGLTAATGGDTVTAPIETPAQTVEQATDLQAGPMGWAGLLLPVGTVTADGRLFRPGGGVVRQLPLTLSYQAEGSHGGAEAGTKVRVGRILTGDLADAGVQATGDWLDPDADWTNGEAIRSAVAVTDKGIGTVSADVAPLAVSYATVTPDGSIVAVDPGLVDMDTQIVTVYEQWEFMGATLVIDPAFGDARIGLVNEPLADVPAMDPVMVAAVTAETTGTAVVADGGVTFPDGTVVKVGDQVTTDAGQTGVITAVDEDAQTVTLDVPPADGETDGASITVPVASVASLVDRTDEESAGSLTASVAGAYPRTPYRAEWFQPVALDGPTRLTVTEDGRVFGHAAQWGECHVGFAKECVTPPSSPSGYAYFHVSPPVLMDDGTEVPCGKVTVGGGHASTDPRVTWQPALAHYDDSGTGVALVRAHEDDHGVQLTGQVVHGADPAKVEEMRRCAVSGDWRPVGGKREMIAALSVNSAGFPQASFDPRGRPGALVAAGIVYGPPAEAEPVTARDGIMLESGTFVSREDLGSLVASLLATQAGFVGDAPGSKRELSMSPRAELRARLQLAD